MFENAANIRKDSPVRIAGVNVGKVQSVRSVGDAAEVTFTVDEEGQPIREDAQVEIRPRIFLEGNFFLDVKPGSPSAPELDDGGTIPITQTSTAVQLDQILTTLQAPDRENLSEAAAGLRDRPQLPADGRGRQGPGPRRPGRERRRRRSTTPSSTAPPRARDTAIVNEALLGTEPDDLSELIAVERQGLQRAAQPRGAAQGPRSPTSTSSAGALAAESDNLAETVRLLAPTLENADAVAAQHQRHLPVPARLRPRHRARHRGAARDDRASPTWLKQTESLLDRQELGRLAYQLRLTGQPAARSGGRGRPACSARPSCSAAAPPTC